MRTLLGPVSIPYKQREVQVVGVEAMARRQALESLSAAVLSPLDQGGDFLSERKDPGGQGNLTTEEGSLMLLTM